MTHSIKLDVNVRRFCKLGIHGNMHNNHAICTNYVGKLDLQIMCWQYLDQSFQQQFFKSIKINDQYLACKQTLFL